MKGVTWTSVAVATMGLIAIGPTSGRAAEQDWKAVEQALGKPGQLQAGDYMHFWANDDPAKLATALRAALDQTNSRR